MLLLTLLCEQEVCDTESVEARGYACFGVGVGGGGGGGVGLGRCVVTYLVV